MVTEAKTHPSENRDIKKQIAAVVAKHLADCHYRLWLFGSRTQGRATERSDYDLGIMAEEPLNLVALSKLRADLEALPILQQIDVVDLAMASPEFVQHAL